MSCAEAPAARHCRKSDSWGASSVSADLFSEAQRLADSTADHRDARENGGDSQPLPARKPFSKKNRRQQDGDRAIQRRQHAHNRNLLALPATIVQNECASIQDTHRQEESGYWHFPRRRQSLLAGKTYGRSEN